MSEPESNFLPLVSRRILQSDENNDLALALEAQNGTTFKCRLSPKDTRDLVAELIYVVKDNPALTLGSEERLMPLPVSRIEIRQGRTAREALLFVAIGATELLFAVDVDALVRMCGWFAGQIEKETQGVASRQYPPFGRCIYCGATRHSPQRAKLGNEHIIPEALNGRLVLPEASCGSCEGKINQFEQYCLKQTLGPVRYLLNMKTKRPNDRPSLLPIELNINGHWVTRDVPISLAPAVLFLPMFEPPEILSGGLPTRENIYTKQFWHAPLALGDLNQLGEKFGATSCRNYEVSLRGDSFALMLAKIAHAYATAESSDLDRFNPVLPKTILREPGAPPLPYLIGGRLELESASTQSQELRLARGETTFGVVWLVQIRLFAWLGSPTYQVVVSVERPPSAIVSETKVHIGK